MVLHLRLRIEHVRYGRRLPRLPSPMDGDPVPLVAPMVAAFALVFALTQGS
jgi:hypothetical protein